MRLRLTLLAALALLFPPTSARADVRVVLGPTPIPDGNARAAGDLTVINEHLAFALAVQSPAPYGVPRGALVDIAPVTDGTIGRDRVVFGFHPQQLVGVAQHLPARRHSGKGSAAGAHPRGT